MRQQPRKPIKNSSVKRLKVDLLTARNEALHESFRLRGAMADLKRAADELQLTLLELDRAVWKTSPVV